MKASRNRINILKWTDIADFCQKTNDALKGLRMASNPLQTEISRLKLTRTKSMESPVIFILCWPTFTVNLYSPSEASLVDKLCRRTLPPWRILPVMEPNDAWCDRPEPRLRCTVSSELDEVNELHEPAPTPEAMPSMRTGEAFRRMVSSIKCLAWLKINFKWNVSEKIANFYFYSINRVNSLLFLFFFPYTLHKYG